jgi:hypothetical protein
MPFHDLCSRPVFTSTHRSPDSRAGRLRASDRCFDRRPISRALARGGTGELGTDARSPLPAARTPGDDAIGRRVHLLRDASTSPVRGAAHIFMRAATRSRLFGSERAGRAYRWRSLSRSRHDPPKRASPWSAEDPSSRGAPTPRGCEPRAPSIDRSFACAPSKPVAQSKTATADPAWPPGRSFRHGLTRTRCALGPGAFGYSPRLSGRMSPIDFCNRDDP